MKCENCGKEFSNKVFNLHTNRCEKKVEKKEVKKEVKEVKKSDKKKVK